jgi:tryptophan 2,3-dioxygenase
MAEHARAMFDLARRKGTSPGGRFEASGLTCLVGNVADALGPETQEVDDPGAAGTGRSVDIYEVQQVHRPVSLSTGIVADTSDKTGHRVNLEPWDPGTLGPCKLSLMSHLTDPILPGDGATDYERYLRTNDLLSLQKTPETMAHRDELLFQTIHQASELWLKLACFEIEAAIELIDRDSTWASVRLLRRATDALDRVHDSTRLLEHIAPWDYRAVRTQLGHGSGFDSPGFRRTHDVSPRLGAAFTRLAGRRGLNLEALYRDSHAHEDVFQVAERLLDWDQRLIVWRTLHLKLVERIIGGHVIGTQGTPVEVLGKRVDVRYFTDLWTIRDTLTRAQD